MQLPANGTLSVEGVATDDHGVAKMRLMLQVVAGAEEQVLAPVPYRGAGPALQDVVAGHVPVLFDNLPASLPHIRAGRLRPLLVAAPARLPFLPKVPTFGESGLQDLNHPAWFGLAAPPGWPHYKVRGVVEAVQRAQQQVAVHSRLLELGTLPADAGPEGLNRRIREAMARYGTLGRRAGVILED